MHRCKVKVRRVAAHAHHLVAVRHRRVRVRNARRFAAREKRVTQLPLRRLHHQSPHFARQGRQRNVIHVFDERFGKVANLEDQPGLFARRRRQLFRVFERVEPVVAVPHVVGYDAKLIFDPFKFAFTDANNFFRRIRNHFHREVCCQALGKYWVTNDW